MLGSLVVLAIPVIYYGGAWLRRQNRISAVGAGPRGDKQLAAAAAAPTGAGGGAAGPGAGGATDVGQLNQLNVLREDRVVHLQDRGRPP